MAKLNRESRLRERRLDKQAKKDARKLAPAHDLGWPGDAANATTDESGLVNAGRPVLGAVAQEPADPSSRPPTD